MTLPTEPEKSLVPLDRLFDFAIPSCDIIHHYFLVSEYYS